MTPNPTHRVAVAQALLVTFLWSTSWVLIKWGIGAAPALTFAGLRYTLAALCLLPWLLQPRYRREFRRLSVRDWAVLVLYGLIYIAIVQGAQYLGLAKLPAVTVSMLLNFSPLLVGLMGIFTLGERPDLRQWLGLALFLAGTGVYFLPVAFPADQGLAVVAVCVGVVGNSAAALMGRGINRSGRHSPLLVTAISMAVGGLLLLAGGAAAEGLAALSWREWAIIAWLAAVNTALAFTLWNNTLRSLPAMESSIINGTMMIQIALLAWIFLGEGLTWKTGLGVALAAVGAFLVQWRRTNH